MIARMESKFKAEVCWTHVPPFVEPNQIVLPMRNYFPGWAEYRSADLIAQEQGISYGL